MLLSVSEIGSLLFLFPILYSQTSAFPNSRQATNVYNAHESIDFECTILAPFMDAQMCRLVLALAASS